MISGLPYSLTLLGLDFSSFIAVTELRFDITVSGSSLYNLNFANITLETFSVTYDDNGSTGGVAPVDGNSYLHGQPVTVLGNTNGLTKTDHAFAGWNTAADGSGTGYAGGDTFAMGSSDVTLYAQWTSTVRPSAPILISPTGTINQNNPDYVWNSVTGASYYKICIQNQNQKSIYYNKMITAAEVDNGDGTCSINLGKVLADGNYYWLAKAVNAFGESDWSAAKAFTVAYIPGPNTPPATPTLNTPAGIISQTSPEYNWNTVAYADSYKFCIQNESKKSIFLTTYTSAQVDQGDGTCAVTPAKVLPAGDYYWLIRAVNVYGESAWSPGKAFTVAP
jgi:uncharacterized repeat protein (TIGR02543 family)